MDEAVGEVDAHREVPAVIAEHRLNWQAREIVAWIEMLLPSVRLDFLFEVTVFVEGANANERNTQIAGGLAMVTGQDTETAGVNPQTFMEAELGREIDERTALIAGVVLGKPTLVQRFHVGLELAQHGLVHGEERVVLQQRLPVVRLDIDE